MIRFPFPLIPAKAGIHGKLAPRRIGSHGDRCALASSSCSDLSWIPAFAGMSGGWGTIARTALGLVLSLAASAAFAQGSPVKGKDVFDNTCSGCHVLTGQGFGGPALAGVYGRKAGTAPGFDYSDGMKKSGIVWDDTSLREFLADPSKMVPGTSMMVNVSDPQERDDVIAYLKSVSPGSH